MDFLKKLTTLSFQVTNYGQGRLTFRCGKSLKPQSAYEGVAHLPGGGRCELSILVLEGGGGVYVAQVTGPKDSLSLLEQAFLPDGRSGKEQMFYKPNEDDMTRHARTYAVRGRLLPGFKGVTAEISRSGAMVMLTGPIQEGLALSLQVDLDDVELEPLGVEGQVDWCKQRDPKTWIASISFKPLTPENDEIMTKFLEDLKYRAPGSRPTPEP